MLLSSSSSACGLQQHHGHVSQKLAKLGPQQRVWPWGDSPSCPPSASCRPQPEGSQLRARRLMTLVRATPQAKPPSDSQQEPSPTPEPEGTQSSSAGPSSSDSQPPLLRLLAKLAAPPWLSSFVAALHKRDIRAIRIARLTLIGAIFVTVAFTRQVMDARTQVRTREVLYSDFVTLLDTGRVRAARLESGTGRLYFDVQPAATTATATPQAAAAAAASAAAVTATTAVVNAAAGAAAAPAQSAADASSAPAASTTATSKPAPVRFHKQYMVSLADKNDYLLATKIIAANVEFGILKKGFGAALANVFLTALAVWIPLLPVFFLLRRIMEERGATKKKQPAGKSRNVAVTFRDVAGVDSAKEELMEVVTLMRSAKAAYTKLKVKMPSGVLLCGPPGTGKTLLAKAVAGEAGVPFFSFSASEFVELYVGRGAARVREVFTEARKAAPCVVFIDELDAMGARRGMGYNDERDQTLNQLLTELDGFEDRQGILFLAATNRMEILDPALLRPGRISRKVTVPLPDERGRGDILRVHLRSTPMEDEQDKAEACERLARVTNGFSGAELANVVNEAALMAARKEQEVVTIRELIEGVQRTKYGVNGAPKTGIAVELQRWLMDVASAPDARKVKNATVS